LTEGHITEQLNRGRQRGGKYKPRKGPGRQPWGFITRSSRKGGRAVFKGRRRRKVKGWKGKKVQANTRKGERGDREKAKMTKATDRSGPKDFDGKRYLQGAHEKIDGKTTLNKSKPGEGKGNNTAKN